MSQSARHQKQRLRTMRREAQGFYAPWRSNPGVERLHEESNRRAELAVIPDGYVLVSEKRAVSFRLPKTGELFVNSDGEVDRAAYPWEEHAFGHGPRWIVRKVKHVSL